MIFLEEDQSKQRDFICPCGKGYFSYAALFTHVKQKHQGKPPGQIIKPKPENKRGRPRKPQPATSPERKGKTYLTPNPNPCSDSSPPLPDTINSNQDNKNSKFIIHSPLKSTPGSQFKCYRADQAQIPTHNELPLDSTPEHSLLEDLASNLVRVYPHKVSQSVFDQIQAARILSENAEESELLECLEGFIKFCREGLAESIFSQIELLMVMLLQHVYELRERSSFEGLNHIHLNDYIESFFDKLPQYVKRWQLYDLPIFLGLNPMKILVVLYNWINSVYSSCGSQPSECLSLNSLSE